ncbi:TetR/AcrR family transcriptional regulator, partial [Corynebacterium sp. HMSC059E07]|uniref:TetR/AcrR family transcriptional regulator n=1 Tax=Corynebacterium sp. HMSC059E07 TaxID=1739471 RepID=UPI000A9ACEC1
MFTEHVHPSRSAAKAGTDSKVLATAYELFLTQGYATTSIRTIASEAGVSVGTVMGVGDKQTLLIRTIGQHISELHDDIRGQSDSLLDVLMRLPSFSGHPI